MFHSRSLCVSPARLSNLGGRSTQNLEKVEHNLGKEERVGQSHLSGCDLFFSPHSTPESIKTTTYTHLLCPTYQL